jgi:hypothetical protein
VFFQPLLLVLHNIIMDITDKHFNIVLDEKKLTVVKSMSGSYSHGSPSTEESWLSGKATDKAMVSSGNAIFRPMVPASAIRGPHVLFPPPIFCCRKNYGRTTLQKLPAVPPLKRVLVCNSGSCCWPVCWRPMPMPNPGGRISCGCRGDLWSARAGLRAVSNAIGHRK